MAAIPILRTCLVSTAESYDKDVRGGGAKVGFDSISEDLSSVDNIA